MEFDKIFIDDLLIRTIIGINPDERVHKQDVIINLVLFTDTRRAAESDSIDDAVNYKEIKMAVMKLVEGSSYNLVEKLASEIASCCLGFPGVERVKVRLEKPGALRFAKSVGIEIIRG